MKREHVKTILGDTVAVEDARRRKTLPFSKRVENDIRAGIDRRPSALTTVAVVVVVQIGIALVVGAIAWLLGR